MLNPTHSLQILNVTVNSRCLSPGGATLLLKLTKTVYSSESNHVEERVKVCKLDQAF